MIFTPAELPGAYLIDLERFEDERGFFARTWSPEDFSERGLNPKLAQCSLSYNHLAGTLRGMHYQEAPHREVKLVRCTAGSIFDVALDLRPESPTFKRWQGAVLSAENRRMFYIPEGFAHGFLTLEDHCEVFYQISEAYAPHAARGVRWDDPAFGIEWPGPMRVISDRDRNYADFTSEASPR